MIIAEVDPNGAFTDVADGRLWEACGLIPEFIHDVALRLPEDATAAQFAEGLLDVYGFGMYGNWLDNSPEASVDSEGRYINTEDPPLDPLVEFTCPAQDVTVRVYQYAITGVQKGDEHYITRMD